MADKRKSGNVEVIERQHSRFNAEATHATPVSGTIGNVARGVRGGVTCWLAPQACNERP